MVQSEKMNLKSSGNGEISSHFWFNVGRVFGANISEPFNFWYKNVLAFDICREKNNNDK